MEIPFKAPIFGTFWKGKFVYKARGNVWMITALIHTHKFLHHHCGQILWIKPVNLWIKVPFSTVMATQWMYLFFDAGDEIVHRLFHLRIFPDIVGDLFTGMHDRGVIPAAKQLSGLGER